MNSYIIFGHGTEELGSQNIVPPGCMLVVAEDCGMTGTVPWHIYDKLADPANSDYFKDPLVYKEEVQRILQKSIHIYKAGETYPKLKYRLLSCDEDYTYLEPSGVFKIPTPSFIKNPKKIGLARYLTESVKESFKGALIPLNFNSSLSANRLINKSALKVTQEKLFADMPGVYYNLLCRELRDEQKQILDLMRLAFSEEHINVNGISGSYDFFGSIAYWLTTLDESKLSGVQNEAVEKIKDVVKRVMDVRTRHSNSSNLITMLNTSIKPSLNKIRTLIETQPEIATNLDKHNLRTPLMVAASFGYNDVMGLLLEHGASANAVDIDGKTALYYAADSSEINSINFLLDNGADPLVGQSILHSIALDDMNDHINNLIDRLIHMGLDINLMDDEGDTAVHIAVINKKYGVVEKLVNSGANCMLANYDGIMPLMSAIKLPNYALFKLLLPKTDLSDRNLRIKLYILAIDKHFEQMAIDLLKTGAYDEIDIGYIKNKVRR